MFRIVTYLGEKKTKQTKIFGDTEHKESYFCLGDLSCEKASAIGQPGHLSPRDWAGRVHTSGISGHSEALAEQLQLILLLHSQKSGNSTRDAQTYHVLGSQQQYALFLLQKTADEKCFRVAVWICHPTQSKDRCHSLGQLQQRHTMRVTHFYLIRLLGHHLITKQLYASDTGEG